MTGNESKMSDLNQRSLKALKALKVAPDPGGRHGLQLAEWALENLELKGPWAHHQQEMLGQVQQMYLWNRADPDQYLLDEESQLPPVSKPEALASVLLENLYENLRRVLPALRDDPT